MPEDKELVVYNRTSGCPYWSTARRVLERHQVSYRQIMIDQDETAMQRVLDWTGFKSIPTIIVVNPGEDLPYEEPAPLEKGKSPRGIDRGSMITEAREAELEAWLRKHSFID